MIYNSVFKNYFNKKTQAASLAAFRVLFGLIMLFSLVRFINKGWVEELYILPDFHFKYYGFSWVKSLEEWTYLLFAVAVLACLMIIAGFKYRLSMCLFFLSFTYIELIDKTTYLNHYYFVSVLSFILIFLPLNKTLSVDSYRKGVSFIHVPQWTVDVIKLMLCIVYFYAGLAKLNSDWLLRAQPLKIWLSSKTSFPVIGNWMNDTWFHFAMSWSGALYDLCIPFLLWNRKTRKFAFFLVIVFHLFTRVLFNIGVFPYVMIVATTIFFDGRVHQQWVTSFQQFYNLKFTKQVKQLYVSKSQKLILITLGFFMFIQLLLPFRYLMYPGELFWTEEGYRFSWRVMLIEKGGQTDFKVFNYDTGKTCTINVDKYLTPFQKKEMTTQPDFILEFAHYVAKKYKEEYQIENIGVFVSGYVSLNARISRPLIDPNIDLLKVEENFRPKKWVLPLNDEIKGL